MLGIDETRRGKGKYEIETSTGAKVWVDRFDTGLVDLDGTGGLFAQVNGRTSAAVIAWLEAQDPEWRARITHVSMDTSATYARAARLALPDAVVVVDRFHLVALANRAVTEYRRELAWARRGRRGRKIDPEWAQRNRLLRAAESLTEDEAAKMHDAMRRADPSGGLEKCWQGKEMLRPLLALAGTDPDRNLIWNQLTDFYTHCADSEIAPAPPARLDRPRVAAIDHRGPDHRDQQRPHRGLQPHRQTRRTDRVRLPEHREPETPDTIRLHPRITPGANQNPQALLTPKSRFPGDAGPGSGESGAEVGSCPPVDDCAAGRVAGAFGPAEVPVPAPGAGTPPTASWPGPGRDRSVAGQFPHGPGPGDRRADAVLVLRSAEVLALQVRDVDIPRRWIRVVGKGDKERTRAVGC